MAYRTVNIAGKARLVKVGSKTDKAINRTHAKFDARRDQAAAVSPSSDDRIELPNKGRYGGRCNLTACPRPYQPATWYNRGSYAFYCPGCARMLNDANRNDSFCRDEPLCREVTEDEAKTLHCSR